MPEYKWVNGIKYVWVRSTTFKRRGKKYERGGYWRVVDPAYVPNGRRESLSEEHRKKISESLKKSPNGRRILVERRTRFRAMSKGEEKSEYRKHWEEMGIPY